MPNPTTDRALVHYRVTKAPPPPPPATTTELRPVAHDGSPGASTTAVTATIASTAPTGTPEGGRLSEEFILDPPTNSVAEVEKRWKEANADNKDRVWVDADLIQPAPPPGPPVEPPPAPPIDSQIVRERARGREELPSTVTEDEEAGPAAKGTIRPAKGDKGPADDLDNLTVAELQAKADTQNVKPNGPPTKANLIAALRASQPQPADDGLDRLTVAELQSRADADGVKADGPQTKANLIAAIRAKHGGGTPVKGR